MRPSRFTPMPVGTLLRRAKATCSSRHPESAARDLPGDHSAGAQEEPHENGSDYRDHERPQASDSVRVQTNHFSSPQERLNRINRQASGGDFTKSDTLGPAQDQRDHLPMRTDFSRGPDPASPSDRASARRWRQYQCGRMKRAVPDALGD